MQYVGATDRREPAGVGQTGTSRSRGWRERYRGGAGVLAAAGVDAGAWDTVGDGVHLVPLRSLGVVLIFVVVLPAMQTMRKSFQSFPGEVQDHLLVHLSSWDKHGDVHRGVTQFQDFNSLVAAFRKKNEWWDHTVTCALIKL